MRLAAGPQVAFARAAGEPHADRFGAAGARVFSVVIGAAWLARHGLDRPPWTGIARLAGEPAWLFRRLHREFRSGGPLVIHGILLTLLGEVERAAGLRRVQALLNRHDSACRLAVRRAGRTRTILLANGPAPRTR